MAEFVLIAIWLTGTLGFAAATRPWQGRHFHPVVECAFVVAWPISVPVGWALVWWFTRPHA